MTWIRSLTRRSIVKYYFCLLLLLGTVKSEGDQLKVTGQPNGGRNTSEDSVNVPSSVVKDGGCGEQWCSYFSDNELLALEAIRSLHRQIDDDKNGNIDFDESDEFLREELKYEGDYVNRQKKFHQNDDNHISVRELWGSWVQSEVHNWTVAQTLEWLTLYVGLPQYSQSFIDNSINGSFLPRLAINHQLLISTVGIKDTIHRQKILLKAQDVVLFGSPKEHGNRMKDSILTTLLVVALIVCWCVYSRYKLSQRDLNKMIKDMESLAKAEQALMDLQKELEKARTAQQEKAVEEELFKKSLDDGIPCTEEINRLKGEVEVLRNELQRAEVELQDKCWVPPPALQHWLQYTYELELKSYNRKKQSAEKQLKQAKDACDKLKKKRSSLMGAFVSTHGRSIDDVDKAILEARTALTEITQELQERMYRWKQIEMLVGGPIMNNPGLPYLETILRGIGRGPPYVGPGSVISNSQDDIDDDGASSIYCPSAVSAPASGSTVHMPIMRSKSVSSMINLRDGAVSRDGSSKESSTGEEDMSTETSEMTGGRDRRVTFGIRTDHRDPITTLNQQRQSNKEKGEEGKATQSKNIVKTDSLTLELMATPAVNAKGKENVRIWKLLSKNLRPMNNKFEHPVHPLEDSRHIKPTFLSWSRRRFLKSPWRMTQSKERILLQMVQDK